MDIATLALAKSYADGLIEGLENSGQVGYTDVKKVSLIDWGNYPYGTSIPGELFGEAGELLLRSRDVISNEELESIAIWRAALPSWHITDKNFYAKEVLIFEETDEYRSWRTPNDMLAVVCFLHDIQVDEALTIRKGTYIIRAESTYERVWISEIHYKTETIHPIDPKYLPDSFGGDGLPEVSDADNGKVMQVVDGKWQLGTVNSATSSTANIYGVSWDLVSNKLTRTDDAADLEDPIPSVGGTEGSSPFDELMPWSGMKVVDFGEMGSFVEIPKFWYKVEKTATALNIQIADGPADGFHVSPAHMDRGDGKGERDVVYIARYKCAGDMGASVSGKDPAVNLTRAQFRSRTSIFSGLSITDYAMFWTTRMLMLVEYGVWDMQAAIGAGCGNDMGTEPTGATDNMPYHTGTIFSDTGSYGVGVQYRNIEDMWGNVAEFVDGWRIEGDSNGMNVYVTMNPAEFSDTEGGIMVGTIPAAANGSYIKSWGVPDAEGYSWAMFPTAVADEEDVAAGNDYVADVCVFYGPALAVGGIYDRSPVCGPFVLAAAVASAYSDSIGARLQIIP